MPIVMSAKIEEPAIGDMGPVNYEVCVKGHGPSPEEEIWEWAADCDTLDEAVELADQLGKRYYVSITSFARFAKSLNDA